MNASRMLLTCILLAQGFALGALTEGDLSVLDAAFEATFRESPTGGMGVWTDPAQVPTNFTEWAYSLTTREGCLGRFRSHLPAGAAYSDAEICEAFPVCLMRRGAVQAAATNKWTNAWLNDEGIVDNMFFLCQNALASTNNIPAMESIGAVEGNSIFGSDPFHSVMAALGVSDARTRYLCGAATNVRSVAYGKISSAMNAYITVYTNGCDSATSSVVENAAATFNPLVWQSRYWIPTIDMLSVVAVPGYKNSHERAAYVSNRLERADTSFYERRYLEEAKSQLDQLSASDFTTPNFTGTPQW